MTTVDIQSAQTRLSDLIEQAAAGEEILIAKAGRPVARLKSIVGVSSDLRPGKRRLGRLAGRYTVPDNFDDPLPDDVLAAYEGR